MRRWVCVTRLRLYLPERLSIHLVKLPDNQQFSKALDILVATTPTIIASPTTALASVFLMIRAILLPQYRKLYIICWVVVGCYSVVYIPRPDRDDIAVDR